MLNHFIGSVKPAWLPNRRELAWDPRKEGDRRLINPGVLLPNGIEKALVEAEALSSPRERLEGFSASQ